MRKLMSLLTVCLFLIILSACAGNVKEVPEITNAQYISSFMGRCKDVLFLQLNHQIYTYNDTTGELKAFCQKENCTHAYDMQGKNTCQAALETEGTIMGVWNDKIYFVSYPDSARPYKNMITEMDPETGAKKVILECVCIDSLYWSRFYEGYYYYISEYIAENNSSDLKLILNRVALEPDSVPGKIWEAVDHLGFPGLRGCQFKDDMIFLDVSYTLEQALSVYDLKNNEVIIDKEQTLGNAVYHEGHLYHLNELKRVVDIYDMQTKSFIGSFPVKSTNASMLSYAGDDDYIYISLSHFDLEKDASNCTIDIYTYSGEYVNTISTEENTDYNVDSYLFSTPSKIFIGGRNRFWPQTGNIYDVDKKQVANDGVPEVKLFYRSSAELESY